MPSLSSHQVSALVAATLGVNSFSPARVHELLPQFADEGLLSPAVREMDAGELTVRLARAGYDRGMLTSMMAERFGALMEAIFAGSLDELTDCVRDGRREQALRSLQAVRGIGPKVAEMAWTLLQVS